MAIHHQLDWSLCLFREFAGKHPLNTDSEFRAKAATHVLHGCSHCALRQTEGVGGVFGNRKRSLGRGVDGGRVAARIVNDHSVSLKTGMMNSRRVVFSFNDGVGARKRSFYLLR